MHLVDLQVAIEGVAYQEWWDLDQLLVQFGTTHSVRPRVVYTAGNDLRNYVPSLLPELTLLIRSRPPTTTGTARIRRSSQRGRTFLYA